MSTYWRFECRDHNPPMTSDGEFTQHTEDWLYQRGIELAQRRPLLTDEQIEENGGETTSDYFLGNARRFLLAHPTCNLGLLNEYGERRDLPERAS